MVAHHRLTSPAATDAVNQTEVIPPVLSIDGPKSTAAVRKTKNKKKKQTLDSDTASSVSSNNCSCATSSSQKGIKISRNPKRIRGWPVSTMTARRFVGRSEVDALGLPLGMSIAAVVAQVLERKNAAGERMSVDYLSEICILAVRESLGNIFGDKFDNFVTNFEKSFRSTLMTLRLISGSSQNVEKQQVQRLGFFRRCSCPAPNIKPSSREELRKSTRLSGPAEDDSNSVPYRIANPHPSPSPDSIQDFACPSSQSQTCPQMENITRMDHSTNRELVLHDQRDEYQLVCSSLPRTDQLSLFERSVNEQERSNNLKKIEIECKMRSLELKEKQLEVDSSANLLGRVKLSMGVSKMSFNSSKQKTRLKESREAELLKSCLDYLVSGLFLMIISLGYGTYVYSYQKIIEATEVCSPYTESKSWWMPKSMVSFNTGLQSIYCNLQAFSRMLFGVVLFVAIIVLMIQRSSASQQRMPLTVIVLLLGFMCGCVGKISVNAFGGSGNHWLMYWEALCLLHFLSNTCRSSLDIFLNGPIIVAGIVEHKPIFPYWVRRWVFVFTLLFIPLLCGLMPYANPWEWLAHFQSLAPDSWPLVNEN